MNRRNFLSLFPGAVAGIALDQAIPFNRVWSFPKKIGSPHSFEPIGSVYSIRLPPRFGIGDIVSIKNLPPGACQWYVVTAVHESDCDLYPTTEIGKGLHLGTWPKGLLQPYKIGTVNGSLRIDLDS